MGAAWIARLLVERALAFVYGVAFLVALNQFRPLCGERGLVPLGRFLDRVPFRRAPSLFYFARSDRALASTAVVGLLLSLAALLGLPDRLGVVAYVTVWLALWALYLSFVNVGQIFYGFGWESLLLEAGFLAIFLGPSGSDVPSALLWLYRWLLFRVMFGAGLIKLRSDPCWRDLSCMYFHYETQPMPNPLSRAFHRLPKRVHRMGVLFNHLVELPVPFLFFAPQPIRGAAGLLTILFQVILILSGNLSWLNYLTIAVAFSCLDFPQLAGLAPVGPTAQGLPAAVSYALVALVAVLSWRPLANLFGAEQVMNASFDPLHLVNTYGAFGSITRVRREIVLEGTSDAVATPATVWRAYEFKGKPGALRKRPPWIAPYHLRLDWLMWFAAMSGPWAHPWLLTLAQRLLEGDRATLALMGENPFPTGPPRLIRARLYEYQFTQSGDPSGHIWERRFVDEYLPPVGRGERLFHGVLDDLDAL